MSETPRTDHHFANRGTDDDIDFARQLERANAALAKQLASWQEHNDLAPHENCTCNYCAALGEIARLKEQLAEARKDSERLDAVESMWPNGIHIESCAIGNMSIGIKRTCTVFAGNNEYRGKTIREVIDAASEGKGRG